MRKIFICILSLLLSLRAFSDEFNFAKFDEAISGIWIREFFFKGNPDGLKGIDFSAFYEFSPNIIAFQMFETNGLDITPLSVMEKGFVGYNRPSRSLRSCYFYDEILDVFYSWNGYDKKKYQQFIVFEPETEKLYSLQLTKENIERLKSIRKDGNGLNELSECADLVVNFNGDKADVHLKRYQGNLIFGIIIPPKKPLEKVASSFDVKAYMNAHADEMNPGKIHNLRKRLISYFGKCTLEFSGGRELSVYVNLSNSFSMTYYDKGTDSNLSNMNRAAIDLFAPNGISESQDGICKHYYYVPFVKFYAPYATDGSTLLLYTSDQWIKDTPESGFRSVKHAYIGKEDKEGNFVFYSGKEPAKNIDDLCNTGEYGYVISMKKGLEPKFKIKFGEDEIIMWILKDGKWWQNFRMIRSPSDT